MERGEFQQDSVLKQLEVLKEEEKEFQNLKVSRTPATRFPPSLSPAPTGRGGSEPPPAPGHSRKRRWHPGVLSTRPRAHRRAGPASPLPSSASSRLPGPLPGALVSPRVARTGGLSLRGEGCSGTPPHRPPPRGWSRETVCQESGGARATLRPNLGRVGGIQRRGQEGWGG